MLSESGSYLGGPMTRLKTKSLHDLTKKRDNEDNVVIMSSCNDKINRLKELRKHDLHNLTPAQGT